MENSFITPEWERPNKSQKASNQRSIITKESALQNLLAK